MRNFRLHLDRADGIGVWGIGWLRSRLSVAVLDLTGSAADLGYVLAAQVFPMLAFVLLGGVWADRLPRQLVMLASDLVRAVAQAAIALLLLVHEVRSVRSWSRLSAVFGSADAFFTPAGVGLTPLTVSPGLLQQANALRGLANSVTAILGPAFGGAIVAAISPGWALAFDAATFVFSAASLAMLRLPPAVRKVSTTSVGAELREGWDEVRSRKWRWW